MNIFSVLGPNGLENFDVRLDGPTPEFSPVSRAPKGYFVPGFVDVHIHGAFGIDFMECEPYELPVLSQKLTAEGYEYFVPTTITAGHAEVASAIAKLTTDGATPYFHLEGPFISPRHPGAQPESSIASPLELGAWEKILDHPQLKVVTLAPEIEGATELITRLMKRGVRVSMGHSDATYDQARTGYEFGASACTHTFNAMRPFHHREAGLVGYALANDDLYCELIYDRVHVCKEAAAHLLKNKPADRVLAISDCTKAAGLPVGSRTTMWGHEVVVGRGEVRLASNGALAGSATTLSSVFTNLAEDFGPEAAIRACCVNPRHYLGLTEKPNMWLQLDKYFQLVEIHPFGAAES